VYDALARLTMASFVGNIPKNPTASTSLRAGLYKNAMPLTTAPVLPDGSWGTFVHLLASYAGKAVLWKDNDTPGVL
jgi:hypothetical protein